MTMPFIGEIRMLGFNFAPSGWALCNGATLPISQNDTLYNLIGTTYGGDGVSTFCLPNLNGRMPIHRGNQTPFGSVGGAETVTLTTAQIPPHQHTLFGTIASRANTSPTNGSL